MIDHTESGDLAGGKLIREEFFKAMKRGDALIPIEFTSRVIFTCEELLFLKCAMRTYEASHYSEEEGMRIENSCLAKIGRQLGEKTKVGN